MIQAIAPMLVVADVARSAAFYEQVIGLKLEGSFTPEGRTTASWANLRRGAVELMLSCPTETPAGPVSRAQLYIRVDDVLPVLARAKAAGIATRGPYVRFYQCKEIEMYDPDGFQLIVSADTDEPPSEDQGE